MRKTIQQLLQEAKIHGWRLPGSTSWTSVRKVILHRDGKKCVKCGETKALHVHHQFYPDYDLTSLITLCKTCHAHMRKMEPELNLSLRQFERLRAMQEELSRKKMAKEKLLPLEEEDKIILERMSR